MSSLFDWWTNLYLGDVETPLPSPPAAAPTPPMSSYISCPCSVCMASDCTILPPKIPSRIAVKPQKKQRARKPAKIKSPVPANDTYSYYDPFSNEMKERYGDRPTYARPSDQNSAVFDFIPVSNERVQFLNCVAMDEICSSSYFSPDDDSAVSLPQPFVCAECHTDFTPVWKSNNDGILCQSCFKKVAKSEFGSKAANDLMVDDLKSGYYGYRIFSPEHEQILRDRLELMTSS